MVHLGNFDRKNLAHGRLFANSVTAFRSASISQSIMSAECSLRRRLSAYFLVLVYSFYFPIVGVNPFIPVPAPRRFPPVTRKPGRPMQGRRRNRADGSPAASTSPATDLAPAPKPEAGSKGPGAQRAAGGAERAGRGHLQDRAFHCAGQQHPHLAGSAPLQPRGSNLRSDCQAVKSAAAVDLEMMRKDNREQSQRLAPGNEVLRVLPRGSD